MRPLLPLLIVIASLVFSAIPGNLAWSNGGFSTDETNPVYGSHDWISHHALDLLPAAEKDYLLANLDGFLIGTELPDNTGLPDGLGDTSRHHVYFDSGGNITDDIGAERAQTEFEHVIGFLEYGDLDRAARYAGIMSHYIADVAVWGHTMAASTPWGTEVHHSDFESYVNARMTTYGAATFTVAYDGSLDIIDAHAATIGMARNTTFGDGGDQQSNLWMDGNYDWADPTFNTSANAGISRAANLIADVLHTIYVIANQGGGTRGQDILISEVYYDALGSDTTGEWTELYNPTGQTVNLTDWGLCDAISCYTIGPTTIAPYSFFTLSRDTARFQTDFGFPPDIGDFTRGLTNTGEELTLRNAGGTEVDFVAWEDYVPGWLEGASTGKSIQRDGPMADTDTYRDWLGSRSLTPQTQANSSLIDYLLPAGFHLISLPLDPGTGDLATILAPVSDSLVMAWTYDGATGNWESRSPSRPAYMDTFLTLDPGQGFFLRTDRIDNLRVIGPPLNGTAIALVSGWNLVGYPSLTDRSVATALTGIAYDEVQILNFTTLGYDTLAGSDLFTHGQGYWIRSQGAQVWNVDP